MPSVQYKHDLLALPRKTHLEYERHREDARGIVKEKKGESGEQKIALSLSHFFVLAIAESPT
jgi:hypothetical protein